MINFIRGKYIDSFDNMIVVDVNGIGYEINYPASKMSLLGEKGSEVTVYTYMAVRENDVSLYGFSRREEKEIFKKILSVSSIGAATALSIVGFYDLSDLVLYIVTGDIKALSKIPKLGNKKAERIILELKDKIDASIKASDTASSNESEEAILALESLGYDRSRASLAVSKCGDVKGLDSAQIIKQALKYLI